MGDCERQGKSGSRAEKGLPQGLGSHGSSNPLAPVFLEKREGLTQRRA